jgi:hypothetical protein
MAFDSYVQVAPDSSGKKVSMDQAIDAAGNTTYLQRALLIGAPADALDQILETQRQTLAVLRALLAITSAESNSRITAEDFSALPGVNFDG